jgi:putative SOS response-associated peptidase YedK
MERYWNLTDASIRNPVAQRFNVAPTGIVPALRRDGGGRLQAVAARWGLIPIWWKESRRPRNTFNARVEEVATKPMWRYPAGKSRCLVAALGWYEWREIEQMDTSTGQTKKVREPYLVQKIDRQPIAFAGLMSLRNVAGEKPEYSCSILTREAAGPVASIHTRMPVALPKDAEGAWLDPELTDPAVMVEFARDNALTDFMVHALVPRADDAEDESANLTEPFANPA